MEIKIYGPGCAKCVAVEKLVREAAGPKKPPHFSGKCLYCVRKPVPRPPDASISLLTRLEICGGFPRASSGFSGFAVNAR